MKTENKMRMVETAKLVPYINNARTHSPAQIAKLRASIREFGFLNPVIIDGDCGIIAGHGRVLAAQEEGMEKVPCVLAEVDHGLVEASASMGFSPLEIIFSVYLKESIPGITRVTMITFVSLIGITAMAGAIGAGGLGDFAIRYGYQMGYRDMIWVTVIIILIIISVIQGIGNFIIKKTTH